MDPLIKGGNGSDGVPRIDVLDFIRDAISDGLHSKPPRYTLVCWSVLYLIIYPVQAVAPAAKRAKLSMPWSGTRSSGRMFWKIF